MLARLVIQPAASNHNSGAGIDEERVVDIAVRDLKQERRDAAPLDLNNERAARRILENVSGILFLQEPICV